MTKMRHVFSRALMFLIVIGVLAPVRGAGADPFFVAVNGSDSWSGRWREPNANRTDGPFATLGAACRAARKQDSGQSRRVVVQAGQYFFAEPLTLDAADSGLTIESASGADVCLYGGRRVVGWKRDGQTFHSAGLPGIKDRKWDFRALIVNGRFCPRARLPQQGFFTHLSKFDGAISVTFAGNCRLLGLEIANVGGQGIKASGDGLHIERCHVHHTGACGIRCRGTEAVVSDNHVHDVGLTYPSAIALQGGGRDCRISHNEIHDCTYTAINCGGERNRIEHNLIYHAMKELHDGGGIYCFAGKDLVLRGNFIRDIIDTGGYGASAYYLDERSEKCLVEGNLSVGIVRPSHNHMAQKNTIRNNVFVSDQDAKLTFPRSSDYIFEKNVICAKGKIVFENPDAMTTFRDNVLFSSEGAVQCHKLEKYNKTGSYTLESGGENLLVDPLLVEFERGLVRFAADSPVSTLGIKPIDVSTAGPRRDAGGQ